jgi:NhaP-type Na+/H+ or K+/H+ antiporter
LEPLGCRFLQGRPLSFPILYVGGLCSFQPAAGASRPAAAAQPPLTEHFTELLVIVALMGAGSSSTAHWTFAAGGDVAAFGVVMPLTIAATALLAGGYRAGPVSALLLGAVLAPTDPVLASDVQVGGPGERAEIRYASASPPRQA